MISVASKSAASVLLVGLLLASGTRVLGQTSFGSVNGTVTDPAAAVIPSAKVKLVSPATNIEMETVTNVRGYFNFVNVRPAVYTLAVKNPGFKTAQVGPFTVTVGQAVTRNVTLVVGEVAQTVEVTATSELLQTSSSELGNVVEEKVLHEIPLNGRNFTQLLILTPGVNPVSTAQGSKTTIGFGAAEGNTGIPGSTIANASVQGQQNRSKIYYLDGIINTSVRGTSYVVLPDIDSLQEFKVQSHNAKAEYGGVTGGVVNMTSKSGSNQFHGSAFWFVRNEIFDARDPFRDVNQSAPPKFRQNQFGANLGGPILRNKTFFFAGYDGWRYRDVANIRRYVPTVELNGDFSQSRFSRDIFNPFSTRIENGKLLRDPFPGRKIPGNLISSMMQGFFKAYMYQPNFLGDPDFNFRQDRARRNDANALQARIDHYFSDKDNIFFRWNEQHVSTFDPQGDKGFRTPEATNRNLGGGFFHTFSPTIVLEVRGGLATQPTEDAPYEHPLGNAPLKELGFPEIDRFLGYTVRLSSNPWFNDRLGVQGPRPRGNPNWNISSDLTWLHGNHDFKTGLQFVHIARLQKNQFGEISFNAEPTRNPQKTSGTGDDLASALLGLPSRIQGYVPELGSIDFGTGTWSAYFQDEWKLRPNLTLTYGLRYDYVTRATGQGLQSGPDMKTGEWLIALEKMPPVCSGQAPPCLPSPLEQIPFNQYIRVTGEPFSIIKPIRDNFGPRMGLAWQIDGKTVLRTGYGVVWDALPSRSQYAQHQFESWGWPQFSGIDTGDINREGDPLTLLSEVGSLPFGLPRSAPWNGSGYFNDPDRKDAYSHQWHVEIQRQMTQSLMMSLAYVGSRNGRLEYAGRAAASPTPGVDSTGRKLLRSEVDQLRPWPHITGSFRYETDHGISNYNSFQYKLQKRFSGGLAMLLSYTWEKSIDTSSGWFTAENGIGGGSNVQNFHDRDSNRAVSSYDVPHLLTVATVWELPFGRGKPWLSGGPAAAALGNWQMNWFVLARSGQPFTVEVGGDPANIGVSGYARPNLVGDPRLSNPTSQQWYNPNAFAIPKLEFGNAGRNILRTDGVWNADFGLQKNVPFGESRQLQFRFEAFNLFNHMDLGSPATRIDRSSPGRITSVSHAPRQLQLGARFVF